MTTNINNRFTFLTVHQFAEFFFQELVEYIQQKERFTTKDAKNLGESVINKLKAKFRNNKSQPVQVFQEAMPTIVSREANKYRRLMDKNFGLSEISFQEMVDQLSNGNEKIYETIFLKHFDSCLSFVKFKYNASHQDAYDASMEAMLAFCKRLKEGKVEYGNIRFLFTQMAGQIYLKWIKRESRKESIEGYDLPEEQAVFDQESIDLLGKAWTKLGENCKGLLESFYHNKNTLKDIAEKTGKNAAALRKQKQRCIEKLRGYFTEIS